MVTKEILLPALRAKADDQARGLSIVFLRLRTLQTDAQIGPQVFVFFMARAGLFVYGQDRLSLASGKKNHADRMGPRVYCLFIRVAALLFDTCIGQVDRE